MPNSQSQGESKNGYLCGECSRIPWGSEEYMFSYPYVSMWGSNATGCKFNDLNCSTCNFIFDCRRAQYSAQLAGDSDQEPRRNDMITLDFSNHGTMIRIVNRETPPPHKFVEASLTQAAYSRPRRVIQPEMIDYALLQAWISYCGEKHGAICGEKLEFSLDYLYVIDCKTASVVQLPSLDEDYIALSYVWGAGNSDPAPDLTLPGVLPTVISDAMVVVQNIGCRYLWVDRYCIPQSKDASSIKDKLIGSMDRIYSNAKLTIVDAASDGPQYGLLGVTSRERIIPPMAAVRDSELSYTVPTGNVVRNCKWYTRGWTFQEGLLSPRLLLFTKVGLLFRCGEMDCMEGFGSIPVIPKRKNKFLHDMRIGGSENSYFSQVVDYMRRDLSFQSDAYNAIRGIIHAFKRTGTPTFCCLPILGREDAVQNLSGHMLLAIALSWSFGSNFGSRWAGAIERRPGFPSWTWLGWMKSSSSTLWHYPSATDLDSSQLYTVPLARNEEKRDPKPHISSIEVEYQNGDAVRLDQGVEAICCESDAGLATSLHMDCWVFKLQVTKSWVKGEYHLVLPRNWLILNILGSHRPQSDYRSSVSPREPFTFQLAETELKKLFGKKDSYEFTCLLLASTGGWLVNPTMGSTTGVAALLLRPHPEKAGAFERFDVFYALGPNHWVESDDRNATFGGLALRRERICLV